MVPRRTYGDRCGVARALDVVGERWALLVVRELLLGPKRFTDLREGLPNVGPDILAQRLRELEQADLVRRRKLAPPAASHVYELTDRAQELEPVILALGRWGSGLPYPPGDPVLGADATMIALKTMFDPAAADGLDARYELRLGEHRYRAAVAAGKLELARGTADDADATIEADPGTLAAVLWHGGPVADLEIAGSRAAAKRFLRLFAA
jgi:DNA-binding HxlR family transcriptional regulator